MQSNNIQEEVNSILARMDGNGGEDEQAPKQSIPIEGPEPIQDIYVLVVREHEEPDQPHETEIIETTLAPKKPSLLAIPVCFFALLLPIASIAFQLYVAFNPFTATVTILSKSQQVALSGTVQLGRILSPITLSHSQTVPTTGRGHQDAKAATGFITFYNGQLQNITVAAGTIVTGTDGVQIRTNETAYIPAADLTANPPLIGHVTVSAHAVHEGAGGNVQAFDINTPCCNSVVAKNLYSFTGGQDARDFQTVSHADMNTIATVLKTSLAQRAQSALQKQMKHGEALIASSCTSQVTADHQVGEEADQVTITVSDACSAIAYNKDGLLKAVTQLLTIQAIRSLGTGYHLDGAFTVTVHQATRSDTTPTLVFSSVSTWVYALSAQDQERIQVLIAGKTKQEAMRLLSSLPGIEHVAIAWRDDTKLPKDIQYIHLVLLIQNS